MALNQSTKTMAPDESGNIINNNGIETTDSATLEEQKEDSSSPPSPGKDTSSALENCNISNLLETTLPSKDAGETCKSGKSFETLLTKAKEQQNVTRKHLCLIVFFFKNILIQFFIFCSQ